MKIAVFHNLTSGGAKRALCETIRRLAARHHIDLYTLSCADHDFCDLRQECIGYHVFNFTAGPMLSSPFGRLNQASRLIDLMRLRGLAKHIARQVQGGQYDVVLVHPCQFEKCPSIVHYLKGPPVVYYCHEALRLLYEPMPKRPYQRQPTYWRSTLSHFDPLPQLYYSTLRDSDRRNIRSASRVLVNSKFTQEAVRRIYQIEAEVNYLGVDTQRFRPVAVAKQRMVLSVGSLTPLKGFDFLIQALSHIPSGERPSLCIASNLQEGLERTYLEELAASLEVDLRLLGNIQDEELVSLYNRAQVAVYASIREPFGFVPLESMACGTPVVAVRDGGLQETVIDGATGLLVGRDPSRFAEAVRRLLAEPGLAAAYGRRGQEDVVTHWGWDQSVSGLESQLAAVAGLHQPRDGFEQHREAGNA